MHRVLAVLSLPATCAEVPLHAAAIEGVLPPPYRGELVRIGLVEALMNAIVHGAFGVETSTDFDAYLDAIQAAESEGRRQVRCTVRASESQCEVVIADEGRGFDWRTVPTTRGHGLSILREVFADVRWNSAGNELSLSLKRAS